MEQVSDATPDLVQKNIDAIGDLFPNVITEAHNADGELVRVIDFDLLRQELADNVVDGPRERYQLDWPGKRAAMLAANAPTRATLRPMREASVDFDTTHNLFIEGDNLEALKLLQESYLGKIKLIYIDPPYNTGNDFIYDDDFAESTAEYLQRSGQVDDSGARLIANTESNGRFHSDWLSMMYSRLRLARRLLSEDGVICVSIDDCEVASLTKIMEEVLGEENFVDTLIWKKRYGGGAKERHFVSVHEYIVIFARDISALPVLEIALTSESIARYYTSRDANFEARGPYRTHPLEATKSMDARPNLVYGIPGPDGDIWPARQWLWGKERASAALAAGELEFVVSRSGSFTVHTKQYLRDADGTQRRGKPFSLIDDVYTQHGTNEMLEIFGDAKVFPFPKPTELIRRLIDALAPTSDDIILDLFAGSGSTAHATLAQNASDGKARRFIAVQYPETLDPDSSGARLGFATIADVGRERIVRAGEKLVEELGLSGPSLDVGFRALRIDSGSFVDVLRSPDDTDQGTLAVFAENVKSDRSEDDLLFQILVDWGLDLSLSISRETIAGIEFLDVDSGGLVACFSGRLEEGLVRAIAERKPVRVVFRDSSFGSDAERINVEQIFREVSKDTQVKVI